MNSRAEQQTNDAEVWSDFVAAGDGLVAFGAALILPVQVS
jgi:hypothetical protein